MHLFEMLELCANILEKQPTVVIFLYNQAFAFYKLKNYEKAMKLAEILLQLAPEIFKVWSYLLNSRISKEITNYHLPQLRTRLFVGENKKKYSNEGFLNLESDKLRQNRNSESTCLPFRLGIKNNKNGWNKLIKSVKNTRKLVT